MFRNLVIMRNVNRSADVILLGLSYDSRLSNMTMFEDKPPRSDWTGIEALSFEDDARLRDLVAMLPAKRAGDDEIAACLVELRAHFQRWLHQDEFGPTRGRQTKAGVMREASSRPRYSRPFVP
jgi:hypothetical protein